MATAARNVANLQATMLESYLVAMARAVERSIEGAIDALLSRNEARASAIFLIEPRINEMEVVMDDHAIRLLREGGFAEAQLRHIVAALKINNDLERMGDLAVNIGQRTIALAQMPPIEPPPELAPMSCAVRAMVGRSLGSLVHRDLGLAQEVLETEECVDSFRDRIFERLMVAMREDASRIGPQVQYLLATRHLERIADHTTNIAEDVVFWLRGLDIRHGRLREAEIAEPLGPAGES